MTRTKCPSLKNIALCCILATVLCTLYNVEIDKYYRYPTTRANDEISVENDDVDVRKDLLHAPFYIGTGQGTTGTRSLISAFCNLGIPSVHYRTACLAPKDKNTTATDRLFEAHANVLQDHIDSKECFISNSNCTFAQGIKILQRLKRHVAQVVTKGGVLSVHDTPYPYMVPHIMKVLRQHSGKRPILVFTDRNIEDWVESRTKHHRTATLLRNDARHALDYAYWLKRLQQGNPNDKCSTLFTSFSEQNTLQEQQEFKAYFAHAALFHRERMLALEPDYQINLFELPTPMNTRDIAADLWNQTRALLPSDGVFTTTRRKGIRLPKQQVPLVPQ